MLLPQCSQSEVVARLVLFGKSYLDLFPKEDLVYLTPNAPDFMTEYDPHKIYIIGGLVDKVVTKPVTMAKAKREGIKMAKLPLDLYMR